MGSCWDRFGISLGSFGDQFGIVLGSFWDRFGIMLVSFGNHFISLYIPAVVGHKASSIMHSAELCAGQPVVGASSALST